MALIQTTKYKGIDIPNSYQRVSGVSYYKTEATTDDAGNTIPASYWLNISMQIMAVKGGEVIDSKGYNMPLDITIDSAYIKQAYNYLKTLPEFSGAIDI